MVLEHLLEALSFAISLLLVHTIIFLSIPFRRALETARRYKAKGHELKENPRPEQE